MAMLACVCQHIAEVSKCLLVALPEVRCLAHTNLAQHFVVAAKP